MVTTSFQSRKFLPHANNKFSKMAGFFRQPRRNLINGSIKLNKLQLSSINDKQK